MLNDLFLHHIIQETTFAMKGLTIYWNNVAICNQKSDKEINKSENEFLICNEHTVIDFD